MRIRYVAIGAVVALAAAQAVCGQSQKPAPQPTSPPPRPTERPPALPTAPRRPPAPATSAPALRAGDICYDPTILPYLDWGMNILDRIADIATDAGNATSLGQFSALADQAWALADESANKVPPPLLASVDYSMYEAAQSLAIALDYAAAGDDGNAVRYLTDAVLSMEEGTQELARVTAMCGF